MKLDLTGLSPQQTYSRSERMVVHLSYLPPVFGSYPQAPGHDGLWEEEFTILRTIPACPKRRCHDKDERLCPECWLLEYVSQVGLEEALTEDLEFEGRGEKECTVVLSGHMVSELLPGNPNRPDEWDENFEVVSIDVLPPVLTP